jgi:molecular chaperone DnaK
MTNYIGIDLGTTNSAIRSFDGSEVQLYKSPVQADVTPSAIFIDRRGNRYVGASAYRNAAREPDRAATLFKRLLALPPFMELPAAGIKMARSNAPPKS